MARIDPQWVIEHDEKWIFTALYIGLSVILSILISLFWLLFVVLLHAVLEWIALTAKGEDRRIPKILWHLKLDFGLVLFALCLGLYLELLFGLVGLGSATRAAAQTGGRAIAWQKSLRAILLTLDDLAQIAKALAARRPPPPAAQKTFAARSPSPLAAQTESSTLAPITTPSLDDAPPWRKPLGTGDYISLILLITCTLLILLSPLFHEQGVQDVLTILASELHPWPPQE